MINQYPGKCALCGETVLAGKGKLMNQRNWLFRVAHKTGQCPKDIVSKNSTMNDINSEVKNDGQN